MADEIASLVGQLDGPLTTVQPALPAPAAAIHDMLDTIQFDGGRSTPADVGKMYEQAKQDVRMGKARERAATMDEPAGLFILRRSIPGSSAVANWALEREYGKATQRMADGAPDAKDYDFIAQMERLKSIDTGRSFLGKVGSLGAQLPAIVGEAAAGGPLVRGLGLAAPAARTATVLPRMLGRGAAMTPTMPSTWAAQAVERNNANGISPDSWKGYATAVPMAVAQNSVLGSLQGVGNAAPGGLLGRAVAKAGIGVGEQQGVDIAGGLADQVLPQAFKTNTHFGLVGDLAHGRTGDALERATLEMLTFGIFAAAHGREPGKPIPKTAGEPAAVAESFKTFVDGKAKEGVPADEVGQEVNRVHDIIKQVVVDPAKAPQAIKTIADPAAKQYAEKLVETVVKPTEPNPLPVQKKSLGPVESLPPETQVQMAKQLGLSVKDLLKKQNEPLIAGLATEAAKPPSAASKPLPGPKPVPEAERPTETKPTVELPPQEAHHAAVAEHQAAIESHPPEDQSALRRVTEEAARREEADGFRAGVQAADAVAGQSGPAEVRPPLPERKPLTSAALAKRVKAEATAGSLANVVRSYGGIDPAGHTFLTHFSGMNEAVEHGINRNVFKTGGAKLDILARELHGQGYLPDAEPQTLIDMLANKTPHAAADLTHAHEAAFEEHARRQQEEAAGQPASESDESGLGESNIDLKDFWTDESGSILMDNAVKRALLGAGRGADPAFRPDADPNPNNPRALPPETIIKQAAANQAGARNTSPMELATTARSWAVHAAQQIANAWGLAHQKLQAFVADPKTRDVELANGTRMPISDAVEAEMRKPGSIPFTTEQKAAYEMWAGKDGIWEKQLKAMQAEGVKAFRDDQGNELTIADLRKEGYFPRPAVPKSAFVGFWEAFTGKGGTSSKPGIAPDHRHAREYATEADGIAAKVQYDPSFTSRIQKFIRDTNVEIADHRLANDPDLGGQSIAHKAVGAAMAKVKPALDALRAAGNDVEADNLERQTVMLAAQGATGNVHVAPAFKGKMYPEDTKRWIETMYGEGAKGRITNVIQAGLKEMTGLVLGPDFSYTTLQLGKMMFRHPVKWAQTVANGPQTLFNSQHFADLVSRSPRLGDAVKEIVQAGGSIGTPPEQAGAFGQGRSGISALLSRGGMVGRAVAGTYDAFGRTFGQIMDLAKLHTWIGTKPTDQAQWPRHIEAIENSLGQGRMEQLGMTPERALLERLFFLAPSYYRAHVKLIQQMGQGGAPGRLARQQVGALAGGVLLTSIGALMAAKKQGWISDDEFEERLNPERGKFLMVPIPLGTSGKTAEVGFGGFYISMIRTVANAVKQDDKPTGSSLKQFYRGHAGMGPRTAWDLATGKDYLGQPISPQMAAGRALAPLAVQQGLMGTGTPAQNAADTAGGLIGLRGFPGSDANARHDALRKLAQKEYGKNYGDLTIPEQIKLVRQFEASASPKPQSSPQAVEQAVAAGQLRQKKLTEAVRPETRAALESLGHKLPTYDTHLTFHGTEVPMTKERQAKYQELLVEEYDRMVGQWPVEKLRAAPQPAREQFMRKSLEAAKERATARLVRGQ